MIIFDGLGKTSGPSGIFNIQKSSKLILNLLKAKILLGFLPKIQDSEIKITKNFRILQCKVFHKCFSIMLWPLLEKPDVLYFGIKGQLIRFAMCISLFLSDILEANEIMAIYKLAQCKRSCYTCIILQNNLNNMNVMLEDMPSRTYKNMQEIIRKD